MAAASASPPGSLDPLPPGFSTALLGAPLEDKYLCSACRNVLRRPVQAQCGHRYCSGCLSGILSSGPQNCAACVQEGIYEEGVSILESGSTFPDNAARREVESLPAVCPSEGCSWKGTLRDYESCHEGHCPFALSPCPACEGLVRLGDRERHAEHECPRRSLSCRHCQAPCARADMEAHDLVCPAFPLACQGCGGQFSRQKLQEHVRTCGRCRVPCRFQAVGCPEMVESAAQPEHEAQRLREHLALLLRSLLEAQRLLGGGPEAAGDGGAGAPGPGPELACRVEALERKTATFENIVCVLNREVERAALTAEACGRQHRLDQERIEALSSQVQQLERSVGLKDLAVAELEQRLQAVEASSCDGVLVWKISDFARKRQEAVSGRTPAIFSPAFYTSRYGYKMCLRVYLNGDGTGRGSHLSLFFVVMRGPHDALLRWPFNQKVTLMLLDQNHREHVIDAFRPDVTSSSFQRPVGDMNIASGCPLFCPVSKLESRSAYVRDDTVFIKAIVDLTGL